MESRSRRTAEDSSRHREEKKKATAAIRQTTAALMIVVSSTTLNSVRRNVRETNAIPRDGAIWKVDARSVTVHGAPFPQNNIEKLKKNGQALQRKKEMR